MQSSYERLAAHRIAQHYGLQSMVVSALFPKVSRILLVKTPDSKLPSIKLADLPFEGSALEKSAFTTNEKIAIKQRESRDTGGMGLNGSSESGRLTPKTMEEREVEYDRARARIFNSADAATETHGDTGASDEVDRQKVVESSLQGKVASPGSEGKIQTINTNRVAIFRDREKDMKDPDYDRSYRRYLQPLEQAGVVFPSLHRVYPPINAYDKYTRFDGPWGHQLQVDQSSYVPPLHVRGPRVESCYPDLSYLPHGQGHSDAYWQCQRFPPHFGHYAQLKNGFPYSCQHGLQSSTSLGALGR
ncbi:hypothetical protein KP509_29G042600 [Ceratopteris richardii]|nr:hypothetical protein KP509_29G042600 [Ceratopteris richardii]